MFIACVKMYCIGAYQEKYLQKCSCKAGIDIPKTDCSTTGNWGIYIYPLCVQDIAKEG